MGSKPPGADFARFLSVNLKEQSPLPAPASG
jgi:hypothetical protein